VARRVNYGFEKRQKEAKRKKKQEAKFEKKRLNKEGSTESAVPVDVAGPSTPDGDATPVNEATRTTPGKLSS